MLSDYYDPGEDSIASIPNSLAPNVSPDHEVFRLLLPIPSYLIVESE